MHDERTKKKKMKNSSKKKKIHTDEYRGNKLYAYNMSILLAVALFCMLFFFLNFVLAFLYVHIVMLGNQQK